MTSRDIQFLGVAPAPKRSLRAALMASAMAASLTLPVLAPYALAQGDSKGENLTRQVGQHPTALLPSLSPIVQKVLPAVVNVSVVLKNETATAGGAEDGQGMAPGEGGPNFPPSPFDEFLKRFFQQQAPGFGMPQPQAGRRMALGSGFIVDPQGYVVTNNHVVGDATSVTVIFQDNSKHPAKIVGRDPKTDIALLKIATDKPLPYVTWGDSDVAKVGDWVIAVGNPFGLGGTVTAGIISARGRDIQAGPFDNFLQLDAPINRGNSGGPTFNEDGQVIGINTAIYSPNGGSVGIGFAIPSSLAKTIVAQLREHGKVERGWLGVEIQQVTPAIASSLGLKTDHGAIIADVTPGSPAAKAGVKQGDVIVKYNGHEVDKMHDLPLLVAETTINSTVALTVWRNGKEEQLSTTIAEMPGNLDQMASATDGGEHAAPQQAGALGLNFAALDAKARRELGVKPDVKGVVVTRIAEDSPAADLGIEPGDIVVAINQQPVTSPQEAADKLRQARKSGDKHLLLLLNRHGISEYVGMTVG